MLPPPNDSQAMVEPMQAEGLPISTFSLVVSDAEQCAALQAHIGKTFGQLDILINAADPGWVKTESGGPMH